MIIETAIMAQLVNLDTDAHNRVFLGSAPQGTQLSPPYIVIERKGGSRAVTLDGTPLFEKTNFDINIFAKDWPLAIPASKAIVLALNGFRGMLGATDGVNVRSCRCTATPSHESQLDGDKTLRFIQSSFLFVYLEA